MRCAFGISRKGHLEIREPGWWLLPATPFIMIASLAVGSLMAPTSAMLPVVEILVAILTFGLVALWASAGRMRVAEHESARHQTPDARTSTSTQVFPAGMISVLAEKGKQNGHLRVYGRKQDRTRY